MPPRVNYYVILHFITHRVEVNEQPALGLRASDIVFSSCFCVIAFSIKSEFLNAEELKQLRDQDNKEMFDCFSQIIDNIFKD